MLVHTESLPLTMAPPVVVPIKKLSKSFRIKTSLLSTHLVDVSGKKLATLPKRPHKRNLIKQVKNLSTKLGHREESLLAVTSKIRTDALALDLKSLTIDTNAFAKLDNLMQWIE